jgi:hypothetical protein
MEGPVCEVVQVLIALPDRHIDEEQWVVQELPATKVPALRRMAPDEPR